MTNTFLTNNPVFECGAGRLTVRYDEGRRTVVLEHCHDYGLAVIDLDGEVAVALADAIKAAGERADAEVEAYAASA